MDPATLGIATTIGVVAGFVSTVFNQYFESAIKTNPHWYDPSNTYFRFGFEYTRTIDDILGSDPKALLRDVKIDNGRRVPSIGRHYYYPKFTNASFPDNLSYQSIINFFNYMLEHYDVYDCRIGFEKVVDKDDPQRREFYWAYVASDKMAHLDAFRHHIETPNGNTITVYTIDTALSTPAVQLLSKISYPPWPNQQQAIDLILSGYTAANNFNQKIFIHGPRAAGKTETGSTLKKAIEALFPGHVAQLFDDFDPNVVGVNVQTMALINAGQTRPVILVINEIDVAFRGVLAPKNDFDPRLLHTRNKQSFHSMLDAIGRYRNVIAIYTSEKSSDELIAENPEFQSFMRVGRINKFMYMTANGTIDEHKAYQ